MNKIFTLFTTLALGTACASAAVISPEQALDRVLQSSGSQVRAAAAVDLQLVQTTADPISGQAAVYVFAAADQPGFIIAAANDEYPHALLGYSDESTYDLDNISPEFQWWLDTQAKAVAKADGSLPQSLSVKKAASKEDISPIVKTKWNQSKPFYNMCPMVNGQRSVTGCVATAMAQLMNVWAWPKQAQGGSVTIQGVTVNFDESKYDWANMKDSYNGSYSTAEADAVAKLMLDCGFASKMSYSPSGSGTSDLYAAQGMLKYFNYDKHLQYVQRNWYSDQEWADLIYSELQEGRPVMICGNDGTVGHAFVCSGFQMQQDTELFHINWGWGGYYDGYFLITDLDPEGTGIGGGSGDAGYNRDNSALIGIQDPVEGHNYIPTLYCDDAFTTDRTKYTRNGSTAVIFPTTIYSVSPADLDLVVALKLVKADGSTSYIPTFQGELKSLYGFAGMGAYATTFPVGSYDVYPVAALTSEYTQGVWYPVYTLNNTLGYCHLDVTDDAIIVTGDQPTPQISTYITDVTPEGTWYPGVTYDVTMQLQSNVEFSGNVALILYKSSTLYAASGINALSLPDPDKTYSATWTLEIPSDIDLGRYTMALATVQDNTYNIIDGSGQSIEITEDPSKGIASVTNVLFVGSSSRGTAASRPATIDFSGEIKVGVECTAGTWNEILAAVLLDLNSGETMGETTQVPLTLNEGDTSSQSLYVNSDESEELQAGTTYQFVPVAVGRGTISAGTSKYYVKFTGELGGVELLNPDRDASAPVEYYNLQGIRVAEPQPGQMVIRRQGSTSAKVRM